MNLWLGPNTIEDINVYTCLIFAILGSLMIFVSVLSSIANGLGNLKTQTICYGIGAVVKVPLAILLVRVIGSWQGVVISNIICLLLYCICEPFVLNRYFKKYSK